MRQVVLSVMLAATLPVSSMAAGAAVNPTGTKAPKMGAPAKMPAVMAAYIGDMTGSVQVQLGGSDVWSLARAQQQLPAGTQIKTMSDSSATIGLSDGTKLRVGPNATFKIEALSNSKVSVFIGLGKLEAWITKFAKRTFQTRNPVAVASVRGTAFSMNVLSPTNATVDLFQGSLAVTDNFGRTTAVAEGQRMEANAATGGSAPAPVPAGVTMAAEPVISIPAPAAAAAPAASDAPADETEAAPASRAGDSGRCRASHRRPVCTVI